MATSSFFDSLYLLITRTVQALLPMATAMPKLLDFFNTSAGNIYSTIAAHVTKGSQRIKHFTNLEYLFYVSFPWALPKVAKLLADFTVTEHNLPDNVTAASERRHVYPSFLFLIVIVS